MNTKQLTSLWTKISILVAAAGLVISVITIDWDNALQRASDVNFLLTKVEELKEIIDNQEHFKNDVHLLLQSQMTLETKNKVLQYDFDSVCYELEIRLLQNRDSLVHTLELMNRGKFPYDTIWIQGESGAYFKTTVTEHFNIRHSE